MYWSSIFVAPIGFLCVDTVLLIYSADVDTREHPTEINLLNNLAMSPPLLARWIVMSGVMLLSAFVWRYQKMGLSYRGYIPYMHKFDGNVMHTWRTIQYRNMQSLMESTRSTLAFERICLASWLCFSITSPITTTRNTNDSHTLMVFPKTLLHNIVKTHADTRTFGALYPYNNNEWLNNARTDPKIPLQ